MKKHHIHHVSESVKQAYSAIASEFDQTRQQPWPEFQHFLAYVRHGSKILDLGCGNGRLARLLTDKDVDYFGVDHNSALLEKARAAHPSARFELMDMADLSALPEGGFDMVFNIAAFHHLPGKKIRRHATLEIHRILKDDGVLILTVWNLFQWKYIKPLFRSVLSCLLHFGFKYAWNDLWIKWGNYPLKRYYHAFLPKELSHYFPSDLWELEEFYFTKKGNRVPFWRSFNAVLIVRKK